MVRILPVCRNKPVSNLNFSMTPELRLDAFDGVCAVFASLYVYSEEWMNGDGLYEIKGEQ